MSQGVRRAFAAKPEQQEKQLMGDSHTEMQKREREQNTLATPAGNDGWADAANEAAERTIRGTLLKFSDWRWTAGKEATEIETGTRLVALATTAGWVRWEDSKPAEYRMRQPGRRLPDREELGYDDQDDWEEGPSGRSEGSLAEHALGLFGRSANRRSIHFHHIIMGRPRRRHRSR
jgi:hypothetical protein